MYRRARVLGITYLPQEPSIFRKLSVADNVKRRSSRRSKSDRSARGASRLREAYWPSLGLTEKGGETRGTLSRVASAARVEITRCLSCSTRSSCCWTSRSPASIRSR